MNRVRVRTLTVVLLLAVSCTLLTACKKDDDFVHVPVGAHTDCDSAVFDPKLDGSPTVEITYAISPSGHTYTVDVKIMDGAALVRLLVDDASQAGGWNHNAQWDGKNGAGEFADPGTYQVVIDAQHATATPVTHQADIDVVRLGVDEISFGGYSMVYPKTSSGNTADHAISTPQWAIQSLDTNTGMPRTEAVPNQSVMYPDSAGASNHNYPFCYAAGSKVQLAPRLGSQAVSNITQNPVAVNYPVTGHPIRIEAEGYSTSDAGADDISPGDTFTFEADTALGASCAAEVLALDFTFSYKDGAEWIQIPGRYSTTHEIYRTVGAPRAVDYNGGGTPESFLYVPMVEWSCTWAAGCTNVKGVADACYQQLEDCGLTYMVLAWYTADMLDDGGGMCDGWNDFFDHLVAVQGFATEKYFYGLSANAGSPPEQKWASIVIKAPGINLTEPAFPTANDYRCVESVYPVPCYISDFNSSDDVDFYQNQHWYKFSSPSAMDGHCINFLDIGGVIYLYDASFRNTAGPNPIAGTFATLPPDGYMQGSGLSSFKSLYYNSAIDYHQGSVYCDHDGNGGTSPVVRTVDIRTSLFGPDELRLYWLKQD